MIPLATVREGGGIVIILQIQGKKYEFLIDTGADVCLVQPYVGDEPTEEIRDAVRGVTGKELEIKGSKRLEFLIGNKKYDHDFLVARFPIKNDGIIGLDLLKGIGARIDLATGELEIDGQKMKLKNHRLEGRRAYGQFPRICRTDQRAERSEEEGAERTPRAVAEARRPEAPTTEEIPVEQGRTKPPTKDGRTTAKTRILQEEETRARPSDEPKEELINWQVVLPQAIRLEPRTLLITRAKITDQHRQAAPKSSFEGWAHAEPVEMPIRGIYTARTISRTFTSSS
jgi:predicted aspartyl protease